ncbi:MAG: thioredoxin family protein [Bacillota bacterium]
MDANRFAHGLTFAQYLEKSERRADLERTYAAVEPDPELVEAYRSWIGERGLRIAAVSADWCPDCRDNVPIFARLAEALGAELRIFERDSHMDLLIPHQVGGKAKIPTFIFYTDDFKKLGAFVERPAAASRFLADGMKKLRADLSEAYRRGLWRDTLREALGDH